MEDERLKSIKESPEKTYELLSLADKGKDVTVRDDQYDFSCLLDSVKRCRRKGFRFRLIDSGRLDRFQLEWLAEAGADIYTSDEARFDFSELELVNRACRRGGAIVAYFHHGPFESEGGSAFSFPELVGIGRCGIYLHLTNRERQRDISRLNELAFGCRKGGSWLVYYHHGALEPPLAELGRNKAWIHISDQSLSETGDALIVDRVKEALSRGVRFVIHIEKGVAFFLLREVMAAGAFVLMKSALFDFKSPFRILAKEARKRGPDFRSCYLFPAFMP